MFKTLTFRTLKWTANSSLVNKNFGSGKFLQLQNQNGFAKSFSSSAEQQTNVIEQSQDGTVKIIKFNRPKSKNAVNTETCAALARAISEADANDAVNILAITGNGDFFTSGNDLMAYKNAQNREEYAIECAESVRNFFGALIDCKKPVVALVNGPAVGMGVTMLGLCDITYASSAATFLTPFARLGIPAEGCSSFTFPKIMGYSRASSMLMFNQPLTADQALNCGLVSEVIPKDSFETDTLKKVRTMSQLPLKALMYSKELIRGPMRRRLHDVNVRETDGVAMFLQTDECYESAMKLFTKKK